MNATDSNTRDRKRLTRERILRVAVRLVDEHGLESLTMRRLGSRLGVEAMALYKHIPSKEALLDGMVEAVAAEISLPGEDDQDPAQSLRALAREARRVAHAHPNIFPLVATRPLNSPGALYPVERVFKALERAGFQDELALHAWRAFSGYVIGAIINELGGHFGRAANADRTRLELALLSEDDFPCVRKIAPHIATSDPDREFEFGLDVILAGLHLLRH